MTLSDPSSATRDYTAAAGAAPADPVSAPADIAVEATAAAQPGLTAPVRRSSGLVIAGVIGVVLLSLVLGFVIIYLIAGLGPDAFALGGIMALIPLAVVFFTVRWIDRWEREPRLAVLFAFLWGAGFAVLIALLAGAEIDKIIDTMGGPGSDYEFFAAAVQAPIVEETGKGLGLLILFWAGRRYFDGPVDGLVYAAWVAGGFAFTENILYFGSQLVEVGGFDESVFEIFLIRGIMSPFAHVMFTACTGIALGIAARRTGALGGVGYFLVGLVPAILLHALWNGALFFVDNFYVYFFLVQFPLFVGAVLIVRFLRRQEAKLTYDRLSEYAAAGWFAPDEVAALATPAGRRQATAWGNAQGKGRVMRQYIKDATKLAFARQRIISGRSRGRAEAEEAALLGAIVESRRALAAPAS